MKKQITSILLALILALQLGITAFAGGTETPIIPTGDNVKINGLSLVLSGEIGLTFYVYVDKQYRNGTMKFTFMGKEQTPFNITSCPPDSSTRRYMATFYLTAVELSEPVTLTVCDSDGQKLDEKVCSAEDYVELLREDEDATEKEKKVAETLINYGHYAQLALSEANGWVIGEDYKETTEFYAPTVDTSVFDAYEAEWQNRSAEFNKYSMSLELDYKTGIHLYLPLTEKPTVTVNGKAAEVTKSERLENNYEIYIDGINALNLENKYEITVNDVTFTLSAFSYCNLAVTHESSQNNIDAMRALYEFYQATVAYNTPAEAE